MKSSSSLVQDLRFALSHLLAKPGSALVAVLSLGLGIGANTALFSVVDAVLFAPLPYREPDRLVRVWETFAHPGGVGTGSVSVPNLRDWQAQNRSFEALGAWSPESFQLGGEEPLQIEGASLTHELIASLGVKPALGSLPAAGAFEPGAPVALLGHGLWQRRFGGDPGIVGRKVEIDGVGHQVLAVMPAGFAVPARSEAELWVPLRGLERLADERGIHWLGVIGRLRPEATLATAREDMEAIARRIAELDPSEQGDRGVRLLPVAQAGLQSLRPTLLALWAAVGLVLLIACGNVTHLLLARSADRERELAVRAALGASRWRLIRLVLAGSFWLALAGGLLGLGIGAWAVDQLTALPGNPLPPGTSVALDGRALAVCAGLCLLVAVVSGLAPALRAGKTDVQATMKNGLGTVSPGKDRLRSLLVAAEIALALVVLVGATLLGKSFLRLAAVDPGFEPDGVLSFRLSLPAARYPDEAASTAFYERLVSRLEALPGVASVGLISHLPCYEWGANGGFQIEGQAEEAGGTQRFAEFRVTSPGYFGTVGVPLLSGRTFASTDRSGAPAVVMINRTFAERYFSGVVPLGRRIGWAPDRFMTIVGVVGDVRSTGLEREPQAELYLPVTQEPWRGMSVVIRSPQPLSALLPAVRQAIAEVDPSQPIFEAAPLSRVLANSIGRQRFSATLFSLFALVALAMSVAGVFGMVAYHVARRRDEIGLRLALGATRGDVMRGVLGRTAVLVGAGSVVGVAAAFALARLLASQLYGVEPGDPGVFAVSAALLGTVALTAAWAPARRTLEVDPARALRQA
ncbi:MAG TPA: ABC transporter permease [Thermoanaerobaculia bacterium]|nr:ABC transporter permease [Thermoanaerobaculia bacterium]